MLFFLSLVLTIGLYKLLKSRKRAAMPFSSFSALPNGSHSLRLFLQENKNILLYATFFCLLWALASPTYTRNVPKEVFSTSSARALYMLIDRSSSMKEMCGQKSKLDIVKSLATSFVQQRKGDFLGVIAFARSAPLICPLTLSNDFVSSSISSIQPVLEKEQDGSAIGYAIFKTLHSIEGTNFYSKEDSRIRSAAILIFTDGLESPNPLDRNNPYRFLRTSEALQLATKMNIRVYYITVVPLFAEHALLQQIDTVKKQVEETKGAFFIATSQNALSAVMQQVDTIEKRTQAETVAVYEEPLQPLLLEIALILLMFYIAVETIFARTRL